jgi:hypothetical protein
MGVSECIQAVLNQAMGARLPSMVLRADAGGGK